jgi:hypothetical protein
VRERRGTVGRLAGLAEGVAAAGRRRQRERSPRVTLYDAEGDGRLLAPDSAEFNRIVAAAERMLELSDPGRRPAGDGEGAARRSSTGGVSVPGTPFETGQAAHERGGRRDEV